MIKKLGFGFMRLPVKDLNDPSSIDMETLNKMVDTFLERGFTYFDTAYMYPFYFISPHENLVWGLFLNHTNLYVKTVLIREE